MELRNGNYLFSTSFTLDTGVFPITDARDYRVDYFGATGPKR